MAGLLICIFPFFFHSDMSNRISNLMVVTLQQNKVLAVSYNYMYIDLWIDRMNCNVMFFESRRLRVSHFNSFFMKILIFHTFKLDFKDIEASFLFLKIQKKVFLFKTLAKKIKLIFRERVFYVAVIVIATFSEA